MKLYKNVDIIDLVSILERGIISMDELGIDNWNPGKRVPNRTDVVYLFDPLTEENSFTQYGAALLEIEIKNAEENELDKRDCNKDKYTEYIVDKVSPNQIKAIYIPSIFKDRDEVKSLDLNITWCDIEANYYGDNDKEKASEEILKIFGDTANFYKQTFNFFRGTLPGGAILDLYNIKYKLAGKND